MNITFCCTGTKAGPWIDGLRAALPDATVTEWAPGAPAADYAVVWAPPQAFLDEQTALRGIFNIGAGVDALMALRLPAGVPVVRLDDSGMAVQMAEFVTHAVVRHFREFDGYEADTAAGRWSYRKPRSRAEHPVGVMGLGVLGQRVAKALSGFEFPVRGWSRSPKTVEGVECFAGEGQFDDFLAGTRILVCLLPLTPDTQDVMRRETLSKLLPGGYVVNVARGGHLVEEDLLALIEEGHLAGAALDVFRTEPLPAGHPFWTHPKVMVTPHTSARTLRDESIAQIAGKILALQAGRPIAGVVEPGRGY
ncbi:glyoxylate/hydroxypyruvate reductase A [Xylophilus sp. Leaf220]|uniref:2-hydroxyacid dehydrogenase n=1 Tax=Xylophilus sp. Leaf220 TaxID=1735686 RepID=UPI0006FC698A|nr:glyoxylate/hydroxypyruvate reductase A [Xylophilus sp. Leaf220]KQM80441.1 glyoxylate/hydroxypyruvate reductase A [Xylophilus sp. Leaf220]